MLAEEIIIAPVVTFKTLTLNNFSTACAICTLVAFLFTLKVYLPSCNSSLLFSVTTGAIIISSANIMHVNGKTKRVGYHVGKTSDWKKAIVTIDTNPSDVSYLGKGGKEVKVSKKYKDSIDEFMGA